MNKKVIAAGMAMVLASMGLTACGDSGSKEAKDSSDETYTVTMAYIGDKEEDTDRIEKKINEIMKKDINMELDIEPISWGAYAETMKLILSGGEKMDIVPILVEQVNSMVNAKQVIDMSEYIDKYGNNIKELLGYCESSKYRKLCIRCDNRTRMVLPVICYYAKRYSG